MKLKFRYNLIISVISYNLIISVLHIRMAEMAKYVLCGHNFKSRLKSGNFLYNYHSVLGHSLLESSASSSNVDNIVYCLQPISEAHKGNFHHVSNEGPPPPTGATTLWNEAAVKAARVKFNLPSFHNYRADRL